MPRNLDSYNVSKKKKKKRNGMLDEQDRECYNPRYQAKKRRLPFDTLLFTRTPPRIMTIEENKVVAPTEKGWAPHGTMKSHLPCTTIMAPYEKAWKICFVPPFLKSTTVRRWTGVIISKDVAWQLLLQGFVRHHFIAGVMRSTSLVTFRAHPYDMDMFPRFSLESAK